MEIIENRLGSLVTFRYDPAYDTKEFIQEIEITEPNTEVRLVNMFSYNETYHKMSDLDMTGKKQYVKVNWGDNSAVYRDVNTILLNSLVYNTTDGIEVKHVYKNPGRYLVKILSVEDLVLVKSDLTLEDLKTSNKTLDDFSTKNIITRRIGGKINAYIPVSQSEINAFIDTFTNGFDLNLSEGLSREDIIKETKQDAYETIPFSWNLTVNKFEGMYKELSFKYVTGFNDFSNMFVGWQWDAENITDDTIVDNLDKTFYNLFKMRPYNLRLSFFMAFTKGILKGINNGSLGSILKAYGYDINDYESENVISDVQFLLMGSKVIDNDSVVSLFEDFEYYGIAKYIKNNPCMARGMFALMEYQKVKEPFDFKLISKTCVECIPNITNNIDLSYMFLGSPMKIKPYVIEKDVVYLGYPTNINIKINYSHMFGFNKNVIFTNINKEVIDIPENASKFRMAYLPFISARNMGFQKISEIDVKCTSIFRSPMTNLPLYQKLDDLFTINGDVSKIKLSIFDCENKMEFELSEDDNKKGIINSNIDLSYMFAGLKRGERYIMGSTYGDNELLWSTYGYYSKYEPFITRKHSMNENYRSCFESDIEGYDTLPNPKVRIDLYNFHLYKDIWYTKGSGRGDLSSPKHRLIDHTALLKGTTLIINKEEADYSKYTYETQYFLPRYSTNASVFVKKNWNNSDIGIIESIYDHGGITKEKTLCSYICYDSDVVTKEFVLNIMSPSKDIIDTFFKYNMAVKYKRIDDYRQGVTYDFKYCGSTFNQLTLDNAFANSDTAILRSRRGGVCDSSGIEYMDRDNYYGGKQPYDLFIGLTFNRTLFHRNFMYISYTDSSYLDKDLYRAFYNNYGLNIVNNIPNGRFFTIPLRSHCFEEMFGIDDILVETDKKEGYSISLFEGNGDDPDEKNVYTKLEAKHGLVFDFFEIFFISEFSLEDTYADKDNPLFVITKWYQLDSPYMNKRLFRNTFKNRVVLDHPIKSCLNYNPCMIEDMEYLINDVEYTDKSIAEGSCIKTNLDQMRYLNKQCGDNMIVLSDPDSIKENINYIPGYTKMVHNHFTTNTSGKDMTIYLEDNIKHYHYNEVLLLNRVNEYLNKYGDVVYYNAILETSSFDTRILNMNNEDKPGRDGLIDFLKLGHIAQHLNEFNKDILIETRVYTNLRDKYIKLFPRIVLSDRDGSLDSSVYTMFSIGESYNDIHKVLSNYKTFDTLVGCEYSYISPVGLTPLCKYMCRDVVNNEYNINLFNSSKNHTSLIGFADIFDLLYNRIWMMKQNCISRISMDSSFNLSSVKLVRNQDMKFISYFDIAKDIDFGADNLVVIDCNNGLIHNGSDIPGVILSKNTELINFGSVRHKNNLKFVLGRLILPRSSGIRTVIDQSYINENVDHYLIKDFMCYSSVPTKLEYVTPTFFSDISNINSLNNRMAVVFMDNIFNNINIMNKRFIAKLLYGNIYYRLKDICKGSHIETNFTRAETMDDYYRKDLYLTVCNFKPSSFKTIEYNEFLDRITLENIFVKPKDLCGDDCRRLIITTFNATKNGLNTTELYDLNKLCDTTDTSVTRCSNPTFIQFRVDDKDEARTIIHGDIRLDNVEYNIEEEPLKHLLENISSNRIKFNKDSVSTRKVLPFRSSNSYTYHYLRRVIFNKSSTTALNNKHLIEIIQNDGLNYGMFLKAIMINENCDYKITYNDGSIDEKTGYIAYDIIECKVLDEHENIIKYVTNIEITNYTQRVEPHRLLTIDLKMGINSNLLTVPNEDMFGSKVFVMDNTNVLFQMMKLHFKRNNSIKDDGSRTHWNINIHKSNFTRNNNTNYNTISQRTDYNGVVIVTDNTSSIDYVLDKGYFNNNSLGIPIPINRDQYTMFIINDTPFSMYNSDGYVYKVDGPLTFDIFGYLELSSNGILYIDDIIIEMLNLSETSDVSRRLQYLSNDFFKYAGTIIEPTENFKMSTRDLTWNLVDLRIFNPFEKWMTGFTVSFNSQNVRFDFKGHLFNRGSHTKQFTIENSFNGMYGLRGLDLDEPFSNLSVNLIKNSFKPYTMGSYNKFLPEGILNTDQQGTMVIDDSFKFMYIFSKVRIEGLDVNECRIDITGDSFKDTMPEDLYFKYGPNIINFILGTKNVNFDVVEYDSTNHFIDLSYIVSYVEDLTKRIDENLISDITEIKDDLYVHRTAYLNNDSEV